MKKRFLAMLLTFSFVISTAATVRANEEKKNDTAKFGAIYSSDELKKARTELEEKEVNIIITLKENGKTDFSSLKTESGKKARIAETRELRNSFKNKLDALNISYEIIFEYDFLFAGFAIKTSSKNLKEIEKIDGVDSVEISVEYAKPTAVKKGGDIRNGLPIDKNNFFRTADSNDLIKLDKELQSVHNGQGRVVAVLDSGLDVNHPILRVSDVSKGMYKNSNEMQAKMSEVGINYGSWRNDKVVYAHNYYSNGENVKEDGDASHGMHVSGTAVGNPEFPEAFVNPEGNRADELIVGVAPEAQLIFMNVFNKTGNTFTHAYAKAVEDSVKLGADSVNLSLGAPNGTEVNVGRAMDKAIEFARSMGSIVAIAAGNDGHFGYSNNLPVATNPDYGTVGSPGVAKDALTVAAMNTTVERSSIVKVEGVGVLKVGPVTFGAGQTDDFLKGSNEKTYDYVVVPGVGAEEDFNGLDVNGKVALIKRGAMTFASKIINAQNRGAIGVIIYNHENGGDAIMGMDYGPQSGDVKIPAVFMGVTDGTNMANNSGEKKVTFTTALLASPYADGGTMTDFSSYGYSTDGEFKPDITAPGGLIYSSINDGRYMSMNGTSMATPHVAGAIPIVRKALIEKNLGITGEKEYDLIKSLLMSTADPVFDKGTNNYVSPRKQGAGSLNVKKAISTDVYLVHEKDNMPKVALRNLESSTFEFNVKVVNFGNKDYNLKYHTVLGTDEVQDGVFVLKTRTLKNIEGANITVPANSEKSVTISVDASEFDAELKELMPNGFFLEGFVIFNDSADGGEVVSIPFSGFRGKWEDIPVFEKPIYDFGFENSQFKTDDRPMYFENYRGYTEYGITANGTYLATLENNPFAFDKIWGQGGEFNLYGAYNTIPSGFDFITKSLLRDKIAFSPNSDGNKDSILFQGVVYRNAQYIRADVYKEGSDEAVFNSNPSYFSKNSNTQTPNSPKSHLVLGTEFVGVDNNGRELPEGKYKYVVTANSTTLGSSEQKLEFDVFLDKTAPAIEKPVVENNSYTPSIKDNLSGVEFTVVMAIVNGQPNWVFERDGKFEIPSGTDLEKSMVITYDYAGNISKLHLDGSEVKEEAPEEVTSGVKPMFRVTDFRDANGNLIENVDNIDLFTREELQNDVRIVNLENGQEVKAPFVEGRFLLEPGKYSITLLRTPVFYNPVQPDTIEFEVVEGKFAEVVYTTTVRGYGMENEKGELSVQLFIDGNYNIGFDNYYSYIIKDKDGNIVEKDNLPSGRRVVAFPVEDENGNTDIRFRNIPYVALPEGDYTVEVTTIDSELKLEQKVYQVKIVNGEATFVILDSQEIIRDVVNIQIEGLDELPEGVKVTLVNKETGEVVNIRRSKFNDRVFADFVDNGDYIVKVELPEEYKVDKNDFEITVNNDKFKDKLVISKKTEAEMTEPKVMEISKKVGEELTEKEIIDAVTGLPEGADVVVKTPVNTDSEGKKVAIVTITYKDGSTEEVEVPVNVTKVEDTTKPENPTQPENKEVFISEDETVKVETKDLSNDVILVVEKVENDVDKTLDLDVYEIKFVDKNGKEVKVDKGNFKVTIKKSKLDPVINVYYVDENNAKNPIEFEDNKQFVMFNTTHFSKYAIEYKAKVSPVPTENTTVKPEENGNGKLVQTGHGISSLAVMGVISMLGLAVSFKKKND